MLGVAYPVREHGCADLFVRGRREFFDEPLAVEHIVAEDQADGIATDEVRA